MSSSPKSEKPSTTAEIERVFRVLDADGDGKISETELETVVRALGSPTSTEEVRTMIDEMDADRNGIVDIKDFADFNSSVAAGCGGGSAEQEAELRVAFDMYDADHNGLISPKEIHQVLKKLGDKSSVQDCARMIDSIDSDGDGNVNFEEFKKMMSRGVKKSSDLSPTPNPTPTPTPTPPSSSQ